MGLLDVYRANTKLVSIFYIYFFFFAATKFDYKHDKTE
jgi:hypothetical protein